MSTGDLGRRAASIRAKLGECGRASSEEDDFALAARISRALRELHRAPELDDPEDRRMVVEWLREELWRELSEIDLRSQDGPRVAAVQLELFVSLYEAPRRIDADFPGLRARKRAIARRLRLEPRLRRRLRHHLVFEHYGDLGLKVRPPHLQRALLDRVLDPADPLAERAGALYLALLRTGAGYVDYFLWYHLRERSRRTGRALGEVFARNDGREVEEALVELLRDDAAYRSMLADENLLHSGRMKLVLGRYDNIGLDHLRRLVVRRGVTRWVDLAGGLSTYYLRDHLGLSRCSTFLVDAHRVEPSTLAHVLPLRVELPAQALRWLDDREVQEYAERMQASDIERRVANLLHPHELARALPAARGPILYTSAGSYLGSIHPEDPGLRAAARAREVSGARIGAIRMAETITRALRPGDVLALFGRAGVPYFRGVTWLTVQVSGAGRLELEAVAFRRGYPARSEHWRIASDGA